MFHLKIHSGMSKRVSNKRRKHWPRSLKHARQVERERERAREKLVEEKVYNFQMRDTLIHSQMVEHFVSAAKALHAKLCLCTTQIEKTIIELAAEEWLKWGREMSLALLITLNSQSDRQTDREWEKDKLVHLLCAYSVLGLFGGGVVTTRNEFLPFHPHQEGANENVHQGGVEVTTGPGPEDLSLGFALRKEPLDSSSWVQPTSWCSRSWRNTLQ